MTRYLREIAVATTSGVQGSALQIDSIEELWFALEAKLLASILCQLLFLSKLLVSSS